MFKFLCIEKIVKNFNALEDTYFFLDFYKRRFLFENINYDSYEVKDSSTVEPYFFEFLRSYLTNIDYTITVSGFKIIYVTDKAPNMYNISLMFLNSLFDNFFNSSMNFEICLIIGGGIILFWLGGVLFRKLTYVSYFFYKSFILYKFFMWSIPASNILFYESHNNLLWYNFIYYNCYSNLILLNMTNSIYYNVLFT